MIRGIDHVVILVDELESAMARYRELGFTVVPGGRHPSATENALVSFRDGSYLELIAFWDASDESHPFHRHRAAGPGIIAYALAADDLEGTVAGLRGRGAAYSDPQAGARLRPDGVEVAWTMAFPGDWAENGTPFLIEDVTDRGRRVPGDDATAHANGAAGIARLIVAAGDLAAASATYGKLAGSPPVVQDAAAFDQPARVAAVRAGAHRIEVHEPVGDGPLADRLAARGAGPYAVELIGATARDIWPAGSGGARLRIAPQAPDDPASSGQRDRGR
jgi:hypothetical protein